MKKKTAFILGGLILSAAFFSGCGGNEATEAASQGEQTGDEEEAEALEKAAEEEKSEEGSTEKENGGEEAGEEAQEPEEIKTVAVLLPDETQERWSADGENIREALEDAGYETEILYAEGDGSIQADQVAEMTEKEVDAMLIAPADPYALTEALAQTKEKSIPVFSYDDLIMDSDAVSYYVTFNSREIGHAIGNAIVDNMELEKAREDKASYNIEFLMGSLDDIKSLYLYNGVMEVLQSYLDDGTLVCQSGKTSFNDTGILRFSQSEAERRLEDILTEYYPGKPLDIVCASFDEAAYGAAAALESMGIEPDSGQWPAVTGVGCELEAVQMIAQGSMSCSVYMDRQVLASAAVEMVDTYLQGEDPEVTDYEQYDNGKKIIGTYTCEIQMIDIDNFELMIDKGVYAQEDVLPEGMPDGQESETEDGERRPPRFQTANHSRNVRESSVIESMMASDSRRTPMLRICSPPCWKPFSMTIPAPSRTAPDFLTISMRPRSAQPFARKSSIRRT